MIEYKVDLKVFVIRRWSDGYYLNESNTAWVPTLDAQTLILSCNHAKLHKDHEFVPVDIYRSLCGEPLDRKLVESSPVRLKCVCSGHLRSMLAFLQETQPSYGDTCEVPMLSRIVLR